MKFSSFNPLKNKQNTWTKQFGASTLSLPSEMGLCGVWSNLSPCAEARLFSS